MKLNWLDYNMLKAFHAAKRSPDPHTKHGAFIADEYNRPISDGYNGYPRNCDDAAMPKTRTADTPPGMPDKYMVTLHAEENAILNAERSLVGSTIYVTGEPCSLCWARIIQKGIARVVIGPRGSHMIDERNQVARDLMLRRHKIEIVRWTPNLSVLKAYLKEYAEDILKELM